MIKQPVEQVVKTVSFSNNNSEIVNDIDPNEEFDVGGSDDDGATEVTGIITQYMYVNENKS